MKQLKNKFIESCNSGMVMVYYFALVTVAFSVWYYIDVISK